MGPQLGSRPSSYDSVSRHLGSSAARSGSRIFRPDILAQVFSLARKLAGKRGVLGKLARPAPGEDPAARTHRVEQFTAP